MNWKYIKVSKSEILEWIDELWYLDSVVANKMIFNSFKFSGIGNSLDDSEDDRFKGHEDLEKWDEIIHIENDDKLYLDDDYATSIDSDE